MVKREQSASNEKFLRLRVKGHLYFSDLLSFGPGARTYPLLNGNGG